MQEISCGQLLDNFGSVLAKRRFMSCYLHISTLDMFIKLPDMKKMMIKFFLNGVIWLLKVKTEVHISALDVVI